MKSKRSTSKKNTGAKKRAVPASGPGCLIVIGGNEDKTKDRNILSEIARRTGDGRLVVISAASQVPLDMWRDYQTCFKSLGVKDITHLHVENLEEARRESNLEIFEDASTVFFTGGDQLKITSKLGGTSIVDRVFEIYNSGGTIAGTSAGASVMGETMLVGGENQESHKVGNWMMAPGLGLIHNVLIDQHFAQRGRIGRLLGAVAMNPGVLGIGIDEDTAIIVEKNQLNVIGTNAVYIVDGRGITYTNISEASADRTMSMHNARLHILANDEMLDLQTREPSCSSKND